MKQVYLIIANRGKLIRAEYSDHDLAINMLSRHREAGTYMTTLPVFERDLPGIKAGLIPNYVKYEIIRRFDSYDFTNCEV